MKISFIKILAAVLALTMLFALTGCGDEKPTPSTPESSDVSNQPSDTTTTGDTTSGDSTTTADKGPSTTSKDKPTTHGQSTATQKTTTKVTTTTTTTTTASVKWPVKPSMSVQQAAEKLTNQGYTTTKLNTQHVQVAPYDPKYAFTHHQGMAYFKGKFYVSFSRGYAHEDFPGQQAVIVSSSDLKTWSKPQVIGDCHDIMIGSHKSETTCVNGFLYSTKDKLFAYYMEHQWSPNKYDDNGNFLPNVVIEGNYISKSYVTYTTDGVNWSEPAYLGIAGYESPRQSRTGTWFASAGVGLMRSTKAVPNGFNWDTFLLTKPQITDAEKRGATILTEGSWYQTEDNVINFVMRSDTPRAWLTQSYDNGKTWTDAYPTNFSIDAQMVYFGNLPQNKGYYFVGTTTYGGRYPLVLLVSKDGYNFKKGYVLRDERYTLQQEGWSKGGEYGYQEVMIHGDYMYIACSRYKEVVELTWVKMSDIKL